VAVAVAVALAVTTSVLATLALTVEAMPLKPLAVTNFAVFYVSCDDDTFMLNL
jgi:hypothetical protein